MPARQLPLRCLVMTALAVHVPAIAVSPLLAQHPSDAPDVGRPVEAEMAGYLLAPHSRVPDEFDAGFSMYVAAWPLLQDYPGRRFQTGLFGTWMFAQHDPPIPHRELYSDIEGGLGWWRDTRFATETPKFIMGGVALGFSAWANGPGAGKGRDWTKPNGKYGVAQLSSNVVWPPDGLNLTQGTIGELVGYGYLPLPLATPKKKTSGADVPTGDQCWTLFLNTTNFKGPVTFFTPYFWSRASVEKPSFGGMFLDARPSNPNKAVQMETQYVPAYEASDGNGVKYARIAPTRFPRLVDRTSALVHQMTAYKKSALWDSVKEWFDGGEPAAGTIDSEAAVVHEFSDRGGSTWKIYPPRTAREDKIALNWSDFAKPTAIDATTFGYQWDERLVADSPADGSLVTLPQYYRLTERPDGRKRWIAVSADEVPDETGLRAVEFPRAERGQTQPYVTPDEPTSCWKSPGPVAGPFTAKPGDGSVVTYYWYRFADQPALLNADLTDAERESMQQKVEKLHRVWKKDQEYLPAPKRGQLAELDPALIVTPPSGLEIGYVPIVTRQESDAAQQR